MPPPESAPPIPSQPGSSPPAEARGKPRIPSIDLVRGLVMVLMALDHVRDFFGPELPYPPTDLTHASAALFLTRLVTHLCAPTFVFLAGTAAFLAGGAGRPRAQRSRLLIVRGFWLIILELTVVHFGWSLWSYDFVSLQVIWALGWCMIALAGLIWLPVPVIGLIGGSMVLLHNLLDRWGARDTPLPVWLWSMLHVPSDISLTPGIHLSILYPLVPWIGVMALGYVCGGALPTEPAARSGRWLKWGIGCLVLFAVLRATNFYGNPDPWRAPAGRPGWFATLAFFNTEKYPPSLLYLLMTLGTMFLLLATAEEWRPTGRGFEKARSVVLIFGRVPLFFYLLHLLLIHGLRVLDHWARYGTAPTARDPGHPLPGVYLAWAVTLFLLYPLCVRYDAYKRAHPGGWTRYV